MAINVEYHEEHINSVIPPGWYIVEINDDGRYCVTGPFETNEDAERVKTAMYGEEA